LTITHCNGIPAELQVSVFEKFPMRADTVARAESGRVLVPIALSRYRERGDEGAFSIISGPWAFADDD